MECFQCNSKATHGIWFDYQVDDFKPACARHASPEWLGHARAAATVTPLDEDES